MKKNMREILIKIILLFCYLLIIRLITKNLDFYLPLELLSVLPISYDNLDNINMSCYKSTEFGPNSRQNSQGYSNFKDSAKRKIYWNLFFQYDNKYSNYKDFKLKFDLNDNILDEVKARMKSDYNEAVFKWKIRKRTLFRLLNIK
jgi:hypothetical protein